MNNIQYVPASVCDVKKIHSLECECFPSPWSEKSILDLINSENGICIAAKCGDTLVGYAGMYICADEGMITNIAVFTEFRGHKVGTGLVQALINEGSKLGLSKLCLEVRQSNLSAITLYEKCNFCKVGTRRGYYSSPKEDALLYDFVIKS